MSAGKHPCCKTVASSPSPVASTQSKGRFQPALDSVALVTALKEPLTKSDGKLSLAHLGLPPPSPPGPNSILRI